jgi:dipeptidyl aminopeptidase/acylaminoacyl peptidase
MQDDPTKEAQPMLRFTGLAILATLVGLAGLAARADSAVTTRIVYHAKLRGNNEILVVPSGGGVPTRLTRHRASDSNPTWSADARFIAFESNRRRQIRVRDADVYVMAADGSRVRQLTFSNAFDGDPAWSWLNRIAFESDRVGSSDIWAIDADGADEKQLTKSPAFDGDPAWSPDGSKIVCDSVLVAGLEADRVRQRSHREDSAAVVRDERERHGRADAHARGAGHVARLGEGLR